MKKEYYISYLNSLIPSVLAKTWFTFELIKLVKERIVSLPSFTFPFCSDRNPSKLKPAHIHKDKYLVYGKPKENLPSFFSYFVGNARGLFKGKKSMHCLQIKFLVFFFLL